MKKTGRFKKMIGLLVALAMVFSISGLAVAGDIKPLSSNTDTGFTIVVDPAYSGESYSAYKIFDVAYSDQTSDGMVSYSYTIDSGSAWYTVVSAADNVFSLTESDDGLFYYVTVNKGVTDDTIIAVFTGAGVCEGAVAAASATADFGGDQSGSITLNVTESGPGYYFVTTSLGSVVTITTTDPEASVGDKNPLPSTKKEVRDETHGGDFSDKNSASVGDTLEFQIEISDAAHKSALCLHDYVTEGLTFCGVDTIGVYLNNTKNTVDDKWYTISEAATCENECIFEITFDPKWLDTLENGDVIIVTYEARVNQNAVVRNYNDAYLTYGAGGESVKAETETNVFGFELEKTDGNNILEGAVFTLTAADSLNAILFVSENVSEGNLVYTVYDKTSDPNSSIEASDGIVVGSAKIFGLEAGTYTLKETEAPEGYNKLDHDIIVTIDDNGEVSIADGSGSSVSGGKIKVVNGSGAVLPGTGGMGTTIFYVAGLIVVAGAAVLLVTRRRVNREA